MAGRILIVDDVPTNRALLKAKLSTAYFEVTTVETTLDVEDLAKTQQPDLILIDVALADRCSYDLCVGLKSAAETAHIPVVMITAADATDQRVRGLECGADDFLCKPFDDLTLIARVRALMRVKISFDEMRLRDDTSRELGLHRFLYSDQPEVEPTGRILISASDAAEGQSWSDTLSTHLDIDVVNATGSPDAMVLVKGQPPDIIMIHQDPAGGADGLEVLSALRSQRSSGQSTFIFVVEQGQEAIAAAALDQGASDYISTPFDPNELIVRVRSQLRRKRYSDRLRSNVIDGLKMAVIDPLTGLYNRRYAMQHLEGISERAAREGDGYAILMMDLDEFKVVNDLYGHAAGDDVLVEFARRLQENIRGIDLVARIGGEEFFVAMPATEPEHAAFVAERLRAAIETTPFEVQGQSAQINITVSIGVAASERWRDVPGEVLRNADVALYEAKNGGRNVVRVFCQAA